MRIALVNKDDYSGGAAIACRRLASSLIANGLADVEMFVDEKKTAHDFVKVAGRSELGSKIRFVAEKLSFLIYEKSKEIRWAFSTDNFGIKLADQLKDFDIIHLHWINFGYLSSESVREILKLGKPVFWTLHDMWPFTGGCHHSQSCNNYETTCGNCSLYLRKPGVRDLSFRILEEKKKLLSEFDNLYIIGCSNWISGRAKNSSLFEKFEVRSIPNVVPESDFYQTNKVITRQELGLSENKKYILFAAMKTSIYWKGFGFMKDALYTLRSRLSQEEAENIELIILGQMDNPDVDLGFKINSFGKISDVQVLNKVYNSADVFVSSSIQENLPNSIVEAMMCGIPCVGFDVGGIPELITHKKSGYLADYKDSADLAEGMHWILFNESYSEISWNSCQNACENYSEKNIIDRHIEYYNAALQ